MALEYERAGEREPLKLGCWLIGVVFLSAMGCLVVGLPLVLGGLAGMMRGPVWMGVLAFVVGVGLLAGAGGLLRWIDRAAKRERAWRNRMRAMEREAGK